MKSQPNAQRSMLHALCSMRHAACVMGSASCAIALATLLVVGACGKAPLVPDVPRGPAGWERGVAAACTTQTTDPSDAQVSYQFDWGDGTKSEWSDFMNGGVAFADTHSYDTLGQFDITVRAKNSQKASGSSAPLKITVTAEGTVAWYVGFPDPEGVDSADFTSNTFAVGSDGTAYITCTAPGALVARRPSGASWKFTTAGLDDLWGAPVLTSAGTILIGCSTNDSIYCLNSDGSVKWSDSVGPVNGTGALGANGAAYFQTDDSMVIALNSSNGTQLWTSATGGGTSAPVVGTDGTVYAVNGDGVVYALDPADGSQKWTYGLGSQAVEPLAIDAGRNVLYAASDAGTLQAIDLTAHSGLWQFPAGVDMSGSIVGPDGSVYVSGGGDLYKLGSDGTLIWKFVPTLAGTVSTPALTTNGYVYVLVTPGKKKLAMQGADSLYAANSDGSRRWACDLGSGTPNTANYPLSAPKIDASGNIYIGDGYEAWCVTGVSAPASSIWPMFQHDIQNSGRSQ